MSVSSLSCGTRRQPITTIGRRIPTNDEAQNTVTHKIKCDVHRYHISASQSHTTVPAYIAFFKPIRIVILYMWLAVIVLLCILLKSDLAYFLFKAQKLCSYPRCVLRADRPICHHTFYLIRFIKPPTARLRWIFSFFFFFTNLNVFLNIFNGHN